MPPDITEIVIKIFSSAVKEVKKLDIMCFLSREGKNREKVENQSVAMDQSCMHPTKTITTTQLLRPDFILAYE